MALSTLRDLFVHELKDIYSAEKQITKALPKLAKAASAEGLSKALKNHLEVTQRQIERLEEIFEIIGKSPRGPKCEGMEGLLKEGSKLLEEDAEEAVLDAALISAAQKVEHYEIAAYGCLVTYAEQLGEDQAVRLLQETLEEEGAADKELTQLASTINLEAEEPMEDEDDEEDDDEEDDEDEEGDEEDAAEDEEATLSEDEKEASRPNGRSRKR